MKLIDIYRDNNTFEVNILPLFSRWLLSFYLAKNAVNAYKIEFAIGESGIWAMLFLGKYCLDIWFLGDKDEECLD